MYNHIPEATAGKHQIVIGLGIASLRVYQVYNKANRGQLLARLIVFMILRSWRRGGAPWVPRYLYIHIYPPTYYLTPVDMHEFDFPPV